MNGIKSSTTTISLLRYFIFHSCVLLAFSSSDSDSSLSNLYENLLQREYTGPISFPNHQVERKAQRSPSLRLRFGRRSDPSLSFLGNDFSRLSEEVNKKPIRSPSLRLRFGKRDPIMLGDGGGVGGAATSGNSLNFDDYFTNEIGIRRDQRIPSTRLRWGRRSDPNLQNNNMLFTADQQQYVYDGDDFQQQPQFVLAASPEKRKPVRLRWGRSSNNVMSTENNMHPDQSAGQGIEQQLQQNLQQQQQQQQQQQDGAGDISSAVPSRLLDSASYSMTPTSSINDNLNRLGY